MAEQEQNRTEPATPFRREEARKQGQVAKSLDFNSAVLVLAMILGLAVYGASAWKGIAALCVVLFQAAAGVGAASLPSTLLGSATAAFLAVIVPIAVIAVAFSVLANLAQSGPVFSITPLKPKFERLNPIAGFKRIANRRMLFETFKSLLKLIALGGVSGLFLTTLPAILPGLATVDSGLLGSRYAHSALALLFRLGLVLLLIALLDLSFVRWQYRRQLMMSRRELKEEVKRREGDPQVRAKLRELQRENLRQTRSMTRLPDADVLITNPDHVAIALRYVRHRMAAPEIIAKGANTWALQMKALARTHQIPIYERRTLAHALLKRGAIDRAIPVECYVDVARIYADLEATRRRLVRYEVHA